MTYDDITEAPNEGVYVHGLYLDGAGWDKKSSRLLEPIPKVLFTTLPVVHISAGTASMANDPRLYQCLCTRSHVVLTSPTSLLCT